MMLAQENGFRAQPWARMIVDELTLIPERCMEYGMGSLEYGKCEMVGNREP